MNVWRKLITKYNETVVAYYNRLYQDKATARKMYKEDIDFKFVDNMRKQVREGSLDTEDVLFLIRSILSKLDTTFLSRVCSMLTTDDEEMHKLAETLIEEKLKPCQTKKKVKKRIKRAIQEFSLSTT